MKISRSLDFDAGHRLMYHKGKCWNLHGHRYELKVTVEGEVDSKTGMVIDFSDLKEAMKVVVEPFDHAMILNSADKKNVAHCIDNEYRVVIIQGEPSAENIAILLRVKIYAELKRLNIIESMENLTVVLKETCKSEVS